MALLGALIGVGASLFGAKKQSDGAKEAAQIQQQTADSQLRVADRIQRQTTERFQPFYHSGKNYQNALNFELLGGQRPVMSHRPGNPTLYGGFQKTPGYDFQMQQGQDAIDGSAASRGGLFSGATLKAQQQFGQGLANQEYGNYLNRLQMGAAGGQAAAGNMANAGANYGQMATGALANAGNAGSAGAVAQGNAWNQGIGNALGMWNYQNAQSNTGQNNSGNPMSLWG